MIKVSVIRLQLNRLREGFNGLVEIPLAIQTDPLVIVSERVCRIDTDRSGVVLYGPIELPDLIVGETSIKQCLEMCRQDLQGLAVEIDRRQIVTLLASLVALRVIGLRLVLPLELVLGQWGLLL
jgi:hypothetical protein